MPSRPGIYIFEDAEKKPLYIGKSINVRSRIKQHYEGYKNQTTKAANFIPLTKTLFIKTVLNDLEAIILEANYIKSYLPRYNSAIRDNKTNNYIVFTNPPFPKIRIIHATDIRTLDLDDFKKQVFGPYTSSRTAQVLLKQIRRIFGYCLSPFNSSDRACFNRHLGHCPGACDGTMTVRRYNAHLGKIKKFLSGQFKTLHSQLERNIRSASKKLQFELAESYKEELLSLDGSLTSGSTSLLLSLSDANDQLLKLIPQTLHHPKLKRPAVRIECYDLAHHQGQNYVGSMVVFRNCSPDKSQYRHFQVHEGDHSDPHAMKQIISRRFNHPQWSRPDLIILDGGVPQLSIVKSAVPNDIPVIALAKKRETIYFYDQKGKVTHLDLDLDDPVLNLFRYIRDEAHRFANSYHRRKQSKTLVSPD